MCMDVREAEGAVIFLRKIKEGASENSYGIHVARLAGIPDPVIYRAQEVLSRIQALAGDHPLIPEDVAAAGESEKNSVSGNNGIAKEPDKAALLNGPGLFSDEEIVLDEILSSDPDNMTPLAALQFISRWKKSLSGR